MVLYYALGGGLGHLTRARRVLSALGYSERAALLSASPYARDSRVTGGLPVVHVPSRLGRDRAAFRSWLADLLAALRPDRLLVDSFPGGILGELCGMALPPAEHIARRVRWPAYSQRLDGPLPRYEITRVLERLDARHAERLARSAQRLESFDLPVPSFERAEPLLDEPHWLVVHSGPDREVTALARRAAAIRRDQGASAQILVICPHPPSWLPVGAQWRNAYPVAPFFGYAEKIVSAAGFNVMHETIQVRERHDFVPYFRALDDQSARAADNCCLVWAPPGNPPPPGDAAPRRLYAPAPSSLYNAALPCRAHVRRQRTGSRSAKP